MNVVKMLDGRRKKGFDVRRKREENTEGRR
jgi:hypothetical protein